MLAVAVVGLVSHTPSATANLLSNGSFESAPGYPTVTGPDTTSITSWGVYDGQVHIAGSGQFAPYQGNKSIDMEGLIGEPPGLLEQGFETTPGELYLVEFALAGNPAQSQGVKQLEVSLATSSQHPARHSSSTHSSSPSTPPAADPSRRAWAGPYRASLSWPRARSPS